MREGREGWAMREKRWLIMTLLEGKKRMRTEKLREEDDIPHKVIGERK